MRMISRITNYKQISQSNKNKHFRLNNYKKN